MASSVRRRARQRTHRLRLPLEAQFLRHNIQRPPLHFGMDAADIKTHNASHEHVDAAKERNDNDGRRPSLNEMSVHEPKTSHIETIEHRAHRHAQPKPDRESQWGIGKAERSIYR